MRFALKLLAKALISRNGLLTLNLILALLSVAVLYDLISVLARGVNVDSLDDLNGNVATIMVAFGVLIEERHEIKKLLGLTDHAGERDHLDEISIKYGIMYIVMGLFIEVFVEATKIPFRIFEGGPVETGLIGVSVALSLGGFWGSILFFREILFSKEETPSGVH